MDDTARTGESTLRRYLDPDRVLRIATGDFGPLFRAYEGHVRRWELPLDGLSFTMMRDGLAALGLHLSTRPPTETVGITLSIQPVPLNLFLTGDAQDLELTGRVFTEGVQPSVTSRMFVQAFRPETGPLQSVMDVAGLDVLRMFEEYYARSEQFPAKFVCLEGDRYALVQALPDGGRERVEALDDDGVRGLLAGPLDLLLEHTLRFRCGCNERKILDALHTIFQDRADELFQADPAVEAFCPRCGARWWVERSRFDAPSGDVPPALPTGDSGCEPPR